MRELGSATIAAVQDGLAGWLRVPLQTFCSPATRVIGREDAGAVVVVALLDAVVAVGPPSAVPVLTALDRSALLDLDTVLAALAGLAGLTAQPLGSAALSYADRATLDVPERVAASGARDGEVAAVLEACTADEQDESGLAGMPALFVTRALDGAPAAAAGYEVWARRLGQLGALARPEHRGSGHARQAAAAAAAAALDAGLVPQWRSRAGNHRSARLADRLGFVRLGSQLAVSVTKIPTTA